MSATAGVPPPLAPPPREQDAGPIISPSSVPKIGVLAWSFVGFVVAMVIVAATIAVFPAHAVAAPHDRRRRPNIVFVLTDDMTLADLAVMPATRRLIGDEGATFDQFFVNDPACCQSRATILTGRYAHNTGVWPNGGTNGGFETAHRLGLEHDTIATRLQAGGYRTGGAGRHLRRRPRAPCRGGWLHQHRR